MLETMTATFLGAYLVTAASALVALLYLAVVHVKRIADVLEVAHEADILGVKAAKAAGLTPPSRSTEGLASNAHSVSG